MGLNLAKKLSDKLGLTFEISSKENEYTEIVITFPKTNMHKMENIYLFVIGVKIGYNIMKEGRKRIYGYEIIKKTN